MILVRKLERSFFGCKWAADRRAVRPEEAPSENGRDSVASVSIRVAGMNSGTTKDRTKLGDSDFWAQIHVLNGVEQLHAFFHRALNGFAAGNQARTAGTLVDDRCCHSLFKIICAGCTAAVDQPGAAHIAVCHLIAAEVDGMIAGQVGVNALVEFFV